MTGNWQYLGDVCERIVDCPHSTPKWTDHGFIVLRNQNIRNGRLDLSSPSYTDAKHYKHRINRAKPVAGDIIFTREAPMGEVCIIPDGLQCCVGQRQVLLRPAKTINSKYLLYAMQSSYVRNQVLWNEGTGSVVSNVRIPVLKKLKIPRFDAEHEQYLVNTLSSLDDKIELNQRMNNTLEGIAQALFKSWFVDFDPVKAKAEGRKPEGMDDATAALFPSRFSEPPIGLIPEGWVVKSVGDLTKIIKGRSYKSTELSASEVALVTLKSFNRGGGYRKDGLKAFTGTYKTEQEIKPGELTVAFTDVTQQAEVIGKPAIVSESKEYKKLVASLDVGIVRPDNYEHILFYYFLFLSANFQSHIYGHTSGTTVLHLSKEGIPSFEFAYPDKEGIVDNFSKIVGAFYKKISLNDAQIIELSEIRDLLLPRLISGKLRVDEISEAVEAVAS